MEPDSAFVPGASAAPKGGRKRVDYRCVRTGILFVLSTGIPWHDLPLEMGCGSGMTYWRCLRDWQAEGLWQRLLARFVHELKQDGRLADDRLIKDASLVAAKKGATYRTNPCDRASRVPSIP